MKLLQVFFLYFSKSLRFDQYQFLYFCSKVFNKLLNWTFYWLHANMKRANTLTFQKVSIFFQIILKNLYRRVNLMFDVPLGKSYFMKKEYIHTFNTKYPCRLKIMQNNFFLWVLFFKIKFNFKNINIFQKIYLYLYQIYH